MWGACSCRRTAGASCYRHLASRVIPRRCPSLLGHEHVATHEKVGFSRLRSVSLLGYHLMLPPPSITPSTDQGGVMRRRITRDPLMRDRAFALCRHALPYVTIGANSTRRQVCLSVRDSAAIRPRSALRFSRFAAPIPDSRCPIAKHVWQRKRPKIQALNFGIGIAARRA